MCHCNLSLSCSFHSKTTMISEKFLVCIIVMIKLLNPGVGKFEGILVFSDRFVP